MLQTNLNKYHLYNNIIMNFSFLDQKNEVEIEEISNDNFKEITENENYEYFIFDFYATWCGPCKIASQEFKFIASEFENIKFCKIDVDDNDLIDDYEIEYLPTIMVFKKNDFKKHIFKSETGDLSSLKTFLKELK